VNVVVTGGSGGLGREVVSLLRAGGATVTAASRRTGVDLATGEGLPAALDGADVIVHAARHPLKYRAVDVEGTRRIVRILTERSVPAHLIYVSIVGCDRNPYPYYRAKHAAEIVLQRSGLPVTVVRATQFHTLVTKLAGMLGNGPVSLVPRMSFQPLIIAGSPSGWSTPPWPNLRRRTGGRQTWRDRSVRPWAKR
jgi:uncharacterized protein YbjT (DUF2867 family)